MFEREIPFFDYKKIYGENSNSLHEIFESVGRRGAYIMQSDLRDFEKNIGLILKNEFVLGVANATDGLEILLQLKGLKKGDEIIISSHTMLATAGSIISQGGTPIPVDISDDWLISPEAIESAITKRTVGIMPTQLNGRCCDMDKILKIANKYSLFVIEDSAQALGATFRNVPAGTFESGGCFSFYPAKTLGCLGDGGAIVLKNSQDYENAKKIRDHGRCEQKEKILWGRNSRLDNLQAAFLNYFLTTYRQSINKRRDLANCYHERLKNVVELRLPPKPCDGDYFDIFQNFEITASNRDDLREYLSSHGVGTLVQWGGLGIHQLSQLGFDQYLPNVDTFFKNCIMLPMNQFLNTSDVEYVSDLIKNFYAENK